MKLKTWIVAALTVLLTLVVVATLLYRHSFPGEPRDVRTRALQFRRAKCRFGDSHISVGSTGVEGCVFCICKGPDLLQCNTIPDCASSGEKIQVVTTATGPTVGGTVTLINSIESNTNSTVVYHIVVEEKHTQDSLLTWLARSSLKSVPVHVVRLPHGVVPISAKHPLNYARHYLPQLLPTVVGRVIYIEPYSVVQGDIAHLWKTHMKDGDLVASATNCESMGKHSNILEGRFAKYMNFGNPVIKRAKLSPSQCAFDDGIFIIELHVWRYNNISRQLKSWTELDARHKLFSVMGPGEEQLPPFLVVLHHQHTELDPMWSVRGLGSPLSRKYSPAFLETAHLLQWSGPARPWDGKAEYPELWDKYYIPDPTSRFHVVRKNHK